MHFWLNVELFNDPSHTPLGYAGVRHSSTEGYSMLILTRRLGESIQIGNEVVVTITRIQGGNVRIGIEAPHDVMIVRSEICGEVGGFSFPTAALRFYQKE